MINLLNSVFAIEVPENVTGLALYSTGTLVTSIEGVRTVLRKDKPTIFSKWVNNIPPGNWRILFTSDNPSEEDCSKVAEREMSGYKDYIEHPKYFFSSARQSFASLLRSHNLQGRYLIIEKTN